MKSQINVLFKITEFIWKFLLIQTQQVYTAIIRLTLIYDVTTWYQFHQQLFSSLKSIRIEIMTKLKKQQNMCFQQIINVYKVVLIIMMKAETYILSLNLHLNSVVSWVLKRMKKSDMTCQIEAACTIIRRKLCQKEQNY